MGEVCGVSHQTSIMNCGDYIDRTVIDMNQPERLTVKQVLGVLNNRVCWTSESGFKPNQLGQTRSRNLCPPQHLTTFVLDRKDGMVTVEDGIRRLQLLDAKGKVWTQEMLLQVEEKAVSLVDLETKVRPELWMWSWN